MIIMSNKTREFLQTHGLDIPEDLNHLSDLLDILDNMMLNSLGPEYEPTESTRLIDYVYDDLYYNNFSQ